jgi:hypothetical protein
MWFGCISTNYTDSKAAECFRWSHFLSLLEALYDLSSKRVYIVYQVSSESQTKAVRIEGNSKTVRVLPAILFECVYRHFLAFDLNIDRLSAGDRLCNKNESILSTMMSKFQNLKNRIYCICAIRLT